MEDSTTEKTRASVEERVCSFTEGDLDHAMETLSVLWEIASKDEEIEAPSSATVTVSPAHSPCSQIDVAMLTLPRQTTQPTSPVHWTFVKRALIKSIRRGVFFDQMYWARHSKVGDVLRPVYFSSVIMNDRAQQLNNCLLKHLFHRAIALIPPSGKTSRGSKSFHSRSRGRCQRRK